jgi:hypothetical protein
VEVVVVSWKQLVRAVEAVSRRQQRATQRAAVQASRAQQKAQREAERQAIQDAKEAEKARAAQEVDDYENFLELLVSVHKGCGSSWDWQAHVKAPPPAVPARRGQHEAVAVAAVQAFKPGFFEKLFGGDKKRLAELNAAVERARAADDRIHSETLKQHGLECQEVEKRRKLAQRVLASDTSVYAEVLSYTMAFDEVKAFSTRVTLIAAEADVVVLHCELTDDEVVPREELKLTAGGKLSSKELAAGKYWTLYQDHICSCALRVAGEVFAVLPISRVIVNVGTVKTNKSTGHDEMTTLVAVHFFRGALTKINLANIDPSDSMKNFQCRMKFKKGSGFEPVEPITTDEQWVTT